ncbi:MAG: HAD-IIA family hydrolase [Chloroflexota bacterium]
MDQKTALDVNNTANLQAVRFFLLDFDGTFCLGEHLIEGALRFIEVLRSQGKDFLFVTNNSSKHPWQYAHKITHLGLPIDAGKVFTSGEGTARYLAARYKPKLLRLYLVGTPALEEQFKQHGFKLVKAQPQVVVLGFDTTLTYEKLSILCTWVSNGLPYFATHPDINCPTEDGFIPDIGAMIAFVKTSTGRDPDAIIGKPNRLMVEMISQKFNRPFSDLAIIGDRLYTDIALGQACGIPSVLVLSGETRRADLASSPYQPTWVFNHLGELAEILASTF